MSWCLRILYGLGVQAQTHQRDWHSELESVTTDGLEVVLWQKVEPVGGMLGGYLDL